MASSEDIRQQIQRESVALGHKGFLYLYFEDDKIRAVGELSMSVIAPLLLSAISKTMSKGS